jgi:hypothetical protein
MRNRWLLSILTRSDILKDTYLRLTTAHLGHSAGLMAPCTPLVPIRLKTGISHCVGSIDQLVKRNRSTSDLPQNGA